MTVTFPQRSALIKVPTGLATKLRIPKILQAPSRLDKPIWLLSSLVTPTMVGNHQQLPLLTPTPRTISGGTCNNREYVPVILKSFCTIDIKIVTDLTHMIPYINFNEMYITLHLIQQRYKRQHQQDEQQPIIKKFHYDGFGSVQSL